MAAGADKVIAFDPPGAIGLTDSTPTVLLRLHDEDVTVPPKDAAGSLADLIAPTGTNRPNVTDAALGQGRSFSPSALTALAAKDINPGTSLLTRDISIMCVLSWDVQAQNTADTPGAIVMRGLANSSAEYISYGLELVVVDSPSLTGSVRWIWQDTSGALKTQTGASFTIFKKKFTLLTATRRWVSPTEVVLRYYIGDQLLGEVTSADGGIGGGTTGTFLLGTRFIGGIANNFLAGVLDEILIVDRELCLEEIEATWLRITRYQPLGVQLFLENHDPGFPLPTDPGSDAQLDTRMIGQALGYAASKAEEVRANILPQRAYGETLEDWEELLRVTPQPASGIDERRSRVLARMRQRRGCSLDGIRDILPSLLGGGTVDDLQFIAFSNEIDSDFTAIDPLRWDTAPSTASISVVAGAASFQPGAGTFLFDGTTTSWIRMRQTVGGDGKQAQALVKLVFTTPQSTAEAGIYFENACTHDVLVMGLRDVAGSFKVYTESFIAGVSQGAIVQATIGANPAAIWLHLYQTTTDGTWKAAWSTTSATAGYTISSDITHPTVAHWSGCYLRSTGAIAAPRADFDDHRLYMPFSGRPFSAYVLLDRGLGFTPDIDGANSVISAIKHGFTHAAFITGPVFLAGDPDSGAGLVPCGGY